MTSTAATHSSGTAEQQEPNHSGSCNELKEQPSPQSTTIVTTSTNSEKETDAALSEPLPFDYHSVAAAQQFQYQQLPHHHPSLPSPHTFHQHQQGHSSSTGGAAAGGTGFYQQPSLMRPMGNNNNNTSMYPSPQMFPFRQSSMPLQSQRDLLHPTPLYSNTTTTTNTHPGYMRPDLHGFHGMLSNSQKRGSAAVNHPNSSSTNTGSSSTPSAYLPAAIRNHHQHEGGGASSSSVMIKIETELRGKYWRNGRRNLQCFPSCKVYRDYAEIPHNELKNHDFLWGKCRGTVIASLSSSIVLPPSVIVLCRIHSVDNVSSDGFNEAASKEQMTGRVLSESDLSRMKDSMHWIQGEPKDCGSKTTLLSYEFKPKVWKYADDMIAGAGKIKRRNVRYYLQFEVFKPTGGVAATTTNNASPSSRNTTGGNHSMYVGIGSGYSSAFDVGSSRVLARQKKRSAAAAATRPTSQTQNDGDGRAKKRQHSAMYNQVYPEGAAAYPHHRSSMNAIPMANAAAAGTTNASSALPPFYGGMMHNSSNSINQVKPAVTSVTNTNAVQSSLTSLLAERVNDKQDTPSSRVVEANNNVVEYPI